MGKLTLNFKPFKISKQDFFAIITICITAFVFSDFVPAIYLSKVSTYNEYVYIHSLSLNHITLSVQDGESIKTISTNIIPEENLYFSSINKSSIPPLNQNTAYILKKYPDDTLHLCIIRDCIQLSPNNELLSLF